MRRVLVVDNDDLVRAMIVTMLRRAEYHVAEAGDGAQAIRIFESFKPNVVIADASTPGRDGIDLLGHLRERPEPRPRVLILAGAAAPLAGMPGVDAAIRKPFTLQALVGAIENTAEDRPFGDGSPPRDPAEMMEQVRQVNALFERLAESPSWEAVRRDADLSSLVADAIASVESASRNLRAYGQTLGDASANDFIATFGAFGEAWMDFLRTLLPGHPAKHPD